MIPRMLRASRLASFLVVLLLSARALARAGGGEHYSGDSSDGGGGLDVTFLFEILWWLIRLTIEMPGVMAPVWGVLILAGAAWFLFNAKATTRRGLHGLERARLQPDPSVEEALSDLRARDPGFSAEAFRERVGRTFEQIQDAWFRRRLEEARRHASDGLHRRFVALQRLMEAEGRRDALADVQVRGVRPLRVDHGAAFDAITVLVEASLRDTEVAAGLSDDAARARALKAPATVFEEVWTFVRKPDRQSRPGWDVSQGACPNCGAPFTGGAANACGHCGALVNSGAYDWVVSAISQVEAWMPRRGGARGLDALRARDPAACAEVLEDRALLLFWKWVEAFALGQPAALRRVASAAAFDRLQEGLVPAPGGPRLRLPSVGSALLIAVDVDVEGLDQAHVEIRWSAAGPGEGSRPTPRRHVLTLVRATGSEGQGTGLATDRCGNCGAPSTDADAAACAYCGHDVTSAEKDWLIGALVPYEAWQGPAAWSVTSADRAASRSDRVRLLRVVAAVARADGLVDRHERRILKDCARRWGVDWQSVEPLIDRDAEPEPVQVRPERAREVLQVMVALAKVDGRVDPREKALILRTAKHLRIDEAEVEGLLAA